MRSPGTEAAVYDAEIAKVQTPEQADELFSHLERVKKMRMPITHMSDVAHAVQSYPQ